MCRQKSCHFIYIVLQKSSLNLGCASTIGFFPVIHCYFDGVIKSSPNPVKNEDGFFIVLKLFVSVSTKTENIIAGMQIPANPYLIKGKPHLMLRNQEHSKPMARRTVLGGLRG